MQLKEYISDFFNLFYPNICQACGKALVNKENYLCLGCLYGIPRTNFHKNEENPVVNLFAGRAHIERGASFFYFEKAVKYQKMMHHFKYLGYKEIGEILGKHFGADLMDADFFNTIDCIVPVPLHKKRMRERGYNQSDWFAKGLSGTSKIPVDTKSFVRKVYTTTQTKQKRIQRWENVKDAFEVTHPGQLENKHVLLVDDILTTGATMEACASKLLHVKGVKVSVATIAVVL